MERVSRVEPEDEVHDPFVFVPAHLNEAVRDDGLHRRDVVLCHVGMERPIRNLGDEGADRRGGDPTAPVLAADPVPDLALVVAPTPDTAHDLAVDDDRPSDRRAIVAELRFVRDEGVQSRDANAAIFAPMGSA